MTGNTTTFGLWIVQRAAWLYRQRLPWFGRTALNLTWRFFSDRDRYLARAVMQHGASRPFKAIYSEVLLDWIVEVQELEHAAFAQHYGYKLDDDADPRDEPVEEPVEDAAPHPPEPGLYFFVSYIECQQFDFVHLTILESADERLVTKRSRDAFESPEYDWDWQGFMDVISLESLLSYLEGMTPRGCNEWVSGEDAEMFGVGRSQPSPLWFSPLPSPAAD
jgi:hypothetical protein